MGLKMNQMTKFDTNISKLQIRISELMPRLQDVTSQLSTTTAADSNVQATLTSIRRECSDVLVSLKSLFELVASTKPKPNPALISRLQELKRDYERVVDALAACVGRTDGNGTAALGAGRQSDPGGGGSLANHPQLSIETILDREASIRAQYDLITLRFERLQNEQREAIARAANLEREFATKEIQLNEKIAELTRELEEERSSRTQQLDTASRFIGFLSEKTRWLEARVQKGLPVLQYALREELDLYREEERFLNPDLIKAGHPSKSAVTKQIRLIAQSGLFNRAFYARQLEYKPSTDLISHYVTEGWRQGKSPHPLFSVPFYLMRNRQVASEGIEPLSHYIECGSDERKDPHPLFSTEYYSKLADIPEEGQTWLGRFMRVGPSPPSPHPLFDSVKYAQMAQIQDGHAALALLHYVTAGWQQEQFAFSPLFDVDHYRSHFGESLQTEPYLHFALFGAAHGLSPHALFDTQYYLDQLPELDPADVDPLLHYLSTGEQAGLRPSPFFDPHFYRQKYLENRSERCALVSYLTEGREKSYDPHPYFSASLYSDLARGVDSDARVTPDLLHFLGTGLRHLPSESVVAYFRSLKVKKPLAPILESSTPVASSSGKPLISRQYPGKVAYREDAPNVLLVAHVAGEHLFGSERSFLDMVDAIGKIPANLFVVLPRNVPDYTNAIRPRCHRVYIVDYSWWRKGQPESDRSIQAFEHLIKTDRIEAVHVNTIMLREPLRAARRCGVPGIVHVRELIQHDQALQDVIGESSEEIIDQTKDRADWVIGNSDITTEAFAKDGRSFAIPNTIDVDAMDIPNSVQDEIRFGLVSSNVPKKGLSDVVELARLASTRVKKAKFVIIGPDTDLVRQLKEEQKAGLVPNNIEFAGYAASPRQAVEQINVVLNFSHFAESFGRTVLEAMAARRPVIAYRWGALPELVEHKKSGYLVPFKKYADALPFIEDLCKQPEIVAQLGERGRKIAVSKFSLPSYRKKIAEAYSRILPPKDVRNSSAGPLIRAARLPTLKTCEEKPRIAYFCWHFPVPSETFVLNELEALVAGGADVLVFCRQTPWKDFKPSFPITFERVDSPKQLAKRLKETARTIVHAHFVYPVVTDMVWPACEEAEIPFTFIAHAQDIFRHDNDQKNRLSEIGASKWCRALFTLSQFHLNFVVERGFPREKVIINPNAVDTKRFSAAYDEERQNRATKKIVAVHRFVKKKGLDLLIRAAPLIKDLGVQIELYGYGDLEDEYRRLIAETGATNVEIKGQLTQEQVIETMKSADLFAAPSVRTENGDMDGIPTSVVESMAAGVPVLTTNVAGIPDLVIDEITGMVAEPTPHALADAIRRFYAMPSLKVQAIIRAAAARARERHDVVRLTRVLMRVWQNRTVDLIIVAWNNLAELKMVVQRVIENTSLPYHLIICDNQSRREPVAEYLDGIWRDHERITIVHNNVNAMVGPGTNAALEQGNGDYAIYICGKEGVSFARGWEIPIVHAMEEQPDVGLVGTIGYSPTYLHGSQYPTGIELFDKFRNKSFATENPERVFGHVQGGLFGMRRKMVSEIGGFSEDVPHSYTDVEYSFYAESKGWKLANAPGMLALFNKSRPTLSQRFDESLVVAHPVLPDELERYDAVARGKLKHCNLCDWYGPAFEDGAKCPSCGAVPEDRSIYRWLSDGILMYRRLPALAVGLTGSLEREWAQQFQGPRLTKNEFVSELRHKGRIPNRPATFHLSLLRIEEFDMGDLALVAKELRRLTVSGGKILIQLNAIDFQEWTVRKTEWTRTMQEAGFRPIPDIEYFSSAVQYSFVPVVAFEKINSGKVVSK